MQKRFRLVIALIVLISLALPVSAFPVSGAASQLDNPVSFTILHTNDFHGQLQASGSNPGLARVATTVNSIRAAVGADNVLLVDGGDEMQGSLLSNLQKGAPTIAAFNALGYQVATFGNHEFDWGQVNLADRTAQASYPYVTANIVVNDTGNCSTAGWTTPSFAKPYEVKTVGIAPNQAKVAFIGVTTTETPIITVATATQGLCFKDPADSILHYYDSLKASADAIVVLSHLGYPDGGYGYGIPVYGDQTLAQKLITAGKPVPLIIGGHSHTNLAAATVVGGVTTVVQAYYNGRNLGRADITLNTNGTATVAWQRITIATTAAEDPAVKGVIDTFANDPTYLALVNQPIGYTAVDLPRNGGKLDNMMGTFIDDAILKYLNTDGDSTNDIDVFFNNAGGLRTDWCAVTDAVTGQLKWSTTATDCKTGTHDPILLTYGNMFTILPFGNATVVGTMTGAQILQVLNQAPAVSNGVIQPSGLKFSYYAYKDANPGPQPYAWGAFDTCIVNRTSGACEPIDLNKTYKVGTNEFLAPAGGDNYGAFKYMSNITYWGDMLNAVDAYVVANHGTPETAYRGPNGDGTLDNRIVRDGTDTPDSGSIKPITILHHNDSHGNLVKGSYVAYPQLATLIKQERLHNPNRTILLNGGDDVQGDAMMYYFKSAPSGYAADGTVLPANLQTHPMMAVMNAMGYDAMDLGNHEFNFGSAIFQGIFQQAQFPILGANVSDDGRYGLATADGGQGVKPYILKTLDGIKVAILGLTNHRVPNYELPSNIVGLTFSNPIDTASQLTPALRADNDIVVALTHIGFTTNPKSVEVDSNVDTNLAAAVPGLDAIVGSHSHTNPASPEAPYKFLPTIVSGPDNNPVIINQAYRYNNTLGEIILGVRAKAGGGYEVVSRTGQYLSVTMSTVEDPTIKAIVDPYVAQLNAYNGKVVGQTTAPIDTLQAFTSETNGANLQADASVYELAKNGITDVDFHLSGAMTNKLVASAATPAAPVTLTIADMFGAMPYENSLVVLKMNGPQLKAVLERAYRNYYYYKYVPGYGGYSYYTTCMIDTNAVGKITYNDRYPEAYDAAKSYVISLEANGQKIDFNDANKYYNVSTVNYLAAGSCNFNDNGKSLWPLDQVVHDTQFYVRDAVIDYINYKGIVSPAIEGRLSFIHDVDAPVITKSVVSGPQFSASGPLFVTSATTLRVNVSDALSGVASCSITVTGPGGATQVPCQPGDNDFKLSGVDGAYTIAVTAVDVAYNTATFSETDMLDNTSPQLSKTIGDPKFTRGADIYVTSATPIMVVSLDGVGSGVAACTLSLDGGTASPYAGASFTLPGPDGKHSLAVACTDNLGNTSSLSETDIVDNTAPVIKVYSPVAKTYLHPGWVAVSFSAKDTKVGLKSISGTIDGKPVSNDRLLDLYSLALGDHTLVVTSVDQLGNTSTQTVKFSVTATIPSLQAGVFRLYMEHKIDGRVVNSLLEKLASANYALEHGRKTTAINQLQSFIKDVQSQSGKRIQTDAANLLIADAQWVIDHIK
jgi:2',3'-cyclic-nucleotide 2'-phosphodiesterase (5'-nucleotidase family)